MRRISLTQEQFAIVDDEDYPSISEFRWCAQWNAKTQSFYAQRNVYVDGRYTAQSMHREILGLKPGDPEHVDHKNHNTLDNSRNNLRITNNRGNCANRRDQSKYGVGVRKRPSGRFAALVWHDDRRVTTGTYDTVEEAQTARNKFLKAKNYVEYKRL